MMGVLEIRESFFGLKSEWILHSNGKKYLLDNNMERVKEIC